MRLYHRTDPVAASLIREAGGFRSKYPDMRVWFSNRRDGQADGYGVAVVVVELPEELLELDDEFPDGEQHFTARVGDIRAEHFVNESE